jgi:hypothetical protein
MAAGAFCAMALVLAWRLVRAQTPLSKDVGAALGG